MGVCERKGEMEETERGGEEAGQRGTCLTLPLFKIELHNSLSALKPPFIKLTAGTCNLHKVCLIPALL